MLKATMPVPKNRARTDAIRLRASEAGYWISGREWNRAEASA
jgi:hypothetical protein